MAIVKLATETLTLGRYRDLKRKEATASALISAYDAEQSLVNEHGPRNWPRPTMENANNVPTISSVSDPAADPDAATQIIYPFGFDHANGTVVPKEYRYTHLFRGLNPNLSIKRSIRHYLIGPKLKISGATGANAGYDTAIEPGQSWGMGTAPKYCDFTLDGDVFYLPSSQGGASVTMHIAVDGAIMTPVISGSNLNVGSMPWNFYPNVVSHYIKFKFPTVARRKISLVFEFAYCPLSIHTRVTSTITVPTTKRLRWLAFGDSFSDGVISDTSTAFSQVHGTGETMHYMFGGEFEFLNMAASSSGFCDATYVVLPADSIPYPNGKFPSFRKQLLTATPGLDADIITLLCGHNDASQHANPVLLSECAAFIDDARSMHPGAIIAVFGANASPGKIGDGTDLLVEAKIKQVCDQKGAIFVPLQNRRIKFLRGSGKQSATTGDGNCDIYTGPDGIHPTIKGHGALGRMMAAELRNAVAKSLT